MLAEAVIEVIDKPYFHPKIIRVITDGVRSFIEKLNSGV
jgi:hypothetical protein